LGGLGVPDLDKFGRALRLRWLWLEWTDSSRPWSGTDVPCNRENRLLFQASTLITIGDGNKARFWTDAWLDGEAPMNLAPNLFLMVARKGRSVRQELQSNNWVNRLRNRINTAEQVEEFISLWLRIQTVQLQEGVNDSITWRWTANGSYTTRSAYRIQFKGAYSAFSSNLIWKADTENKCKVFMWILIKEKILTADNLQKRRWPCHEHCVLCNGPLETAVHLCFNCGFAKAVWNQVFTWEGINTDLLQM